MHNIVIYIYIYSYKHDSPCFPPGWIRWIHVTTPRSTSSMAQTDEKNETYTIVSCDVPKKLYIYTCNYVYILKNNYLHTLYIYQIYIYILYKYKYKRYMYIIYTYNVYIYIIYICINDICILYIHTICIYIYINK